MENIAINNVTETEDSVKEVNEPSIIKDFFKDEKEQNVKELAELFGQSETELKKEFGSFKAKKIYKKLNYFIDNGCKLKKELISCLETAVKNEFYGVTIFKTALPIAKSVLSKTNVKIRVLINYPLGEEDYNTVKFSLKQAVKNGADEIAVMLSSFTYKNCDLSETIKQVKKLLKIAKKKKLIIVLDSANLSRTDIEKILSALISLGVRSIMIANAKSTIDRDLLDDAIKVCADKIFLELKDGVLLAEQAISSLVSGVDFLTTEFAPEIVNDLSAKISTFESGCKPLDKTDKE